MKIIKRKQKGFTLIELLIVVAILGILAAVAIPALSRFITSSRVGAANGELGLVRTAMQAAMADAGISTLTVPTTINGTTVSSGIDLQITNGVSTYLISTYIQGANTALVGSYTFNSAANVATATYPGGPTWSGTLGRFQ